MPAYSTILNACLPVFLIIGVGYFVRRLRVLTAEADSTLLRLSLNLLYPAFIIDHLLIDDALADTDLTATAAASGAGALFILFGFGIAYLASRWIYTSAPQRRTFAVTIGLQNYGFIPIPIVLALFDDHTIGVLLTHSIGVEIALWTVGVILITGGKARAWRNLVNGPIITTLACLSANALGIATSPPPFVATAITMLGDCAIPLNLLLVGATIRDLFRASAPDHILRRPVAGAATAVFLRLALIPAVILLCARTMPMSIELKRVLVVQAAMPCAVFPIILAQRYGGDAGTALRAVIATSAVAAFSIPHAIIFGLWFTGTTM